MGIGGLVLAILWQFIRWVREAPVKPDPWDAAIQLELESAPEACTHCSLPQPETAWFCPHCGRATGPYNNLMPYVSVFSEGEVLRNGANRHFHNRPIVLTGYLLLGLAFVPVLADSSLGIFPLVLIPLYWISIVRNWKRASQM